MDIFLLFNNLLRDDPFLEKTNSSKKLPYKNQFESHWISGLTFAFWGLGGPKTEQAWHGVDILSDDLQAEIARFTLPGGDVSKHEKEPDRVETKFQVISELGYIFTSILFTANWQKSPKTCSLALIVKNRHLSRYLTLHTLVEDRNLVSQNWLLVFLFFFLSAHSHWSMI